MAEIFSAIIPVFLVAASAYLVRRRVSLDTRTLTTLNIYLLIPALVFSGLSERAIEWGVFARYAVSGILMLILMWVILGLIAKRRGLTGGAQSAFLMTMFMNLGNFGLPVCKFAFGDEGLAFAVVVMVCGSFLQNSFGIYFAQRSRYSVWESFQRVFRFPMIYAFVLAIICQKWSLHVPESVARAVQITGDAAIPIQLIILGVQLCETRLDTGLNVLIATALRLCVGPLLALVVVKAVGMNGLAAKVFIVQMSGPVAVGMGAYGIQFDVAPRFLSSVVAWTFLFSMVTVSMVLFFLTKVSLL